MPIYYTQHVLRIYLLLFLSILIIVIVIALLGIQPLTEQLKDEHSREVTYFLESNRVQLQQILGRHFALSQQAASRTFIRHALRDYVDDKITTQRVVEITRPKLADAQRYNDELLGISRFDKSAQKLVVVGVSLDERHYLKNCPEDEEITLKGPITLPDGQSALLYYSPITEKNRGVIGYDILVIKSEAIQRLIDMPYENTGNIFLNRQNNIVFRPTRLVDSRFQKIMDNYLTQIQPQQGYLIHSGEVNNTDWQITLVVNEDRFFASIEQSVMRLSTWIIIIIILIFITTIILMQPLIKTLLKEKQLYKLSHVDGLTGVYNHRYLQEELDKALARANRHNHYISLLLLDVDHFKRVNDTYGHQAGDTVLKHITSFLSKRLREGDTVARYGGEEFVIIMPHTDAASAFKVAEGLRQRLAEQKIPVSGKSIGVTVSIGVTSCEPGSSPCDKRSLLSAADRAMYAAKRKGRNRVCAAPQE